MIENELCSRCWGSGRVNGGPGRFPSVTCPRCKGTGEEPEHIGWLAFSAITLILIIFLFAIWGIHG